MKILVRLYRDEIVGLGSQRPHGPRCLEEVIVGGDEDKYLDLCCALEGRSLYPYDGVMIGRALHCICFDMINLYNVKVWLMHDEDVEDMISPPIERRPGELTLADFALGNL